MAARQAAIGARPPPAGDPDTAGREDERAGLIGRLLAFVAHRRFEPGDRLPSERELAERFGVGRNAVREAVAVLETLRMVERRPNSGVFYDQAGVIDRDHLLAHLDFMAPHVKGILVPGGLGAWIGLGAGPG